MKKFFKQINDSISDNIDPCIWTLVSGVIALLLLRATTPFSYKEGGLFLGLAFLSVVPVGLMLTDLLAPALQSPSERWALVGILGYAASVLIGYFVGLIGLPQLYLPLCLIFLLVSLGKLLYRFKSEFWPIRKIYIWASAAL